MANTTTAPTVQTFANIAGTCVARSASRIVGQTLLTGAARVGGGCCLDCWQASSASARKCPRFTDRGLRLVLPLPLVGDNPKGKLLSPAWNARLNFDCLRVLTPRQGKNAGQGASLPKPSQSRAKVRRLRGLQQASVAERGRTVLVQVRRGLARGFRVCRPFP
jgi:hypothetical protein